MQFKNPADTLSKNSATIAYNIFYGQKLSDIYKETGGKLDIIGVGGVKDAGIALEKIMAGQGKQLVDLAPDEILAIWRQTKTGP